eukprot:4003073-Pleurochrysis_carterae.AAC.2
MLQTGARLVQARGHAGQRKHGARAARPALSAGPRQPRSPPPTASHASPAREITLRPRRLRCWRCAEAACKPIPHNHRLSRRAGRSRLASTA